MATEEEKVYACPYCGARYKTTEGLVKHLKHCDAKPDADEEPDVEPATGGGIPLYSAPAPKTRTPAPDEDEDEDDDPGDEDEDEYACPECEYSAPKPFRKCPKCGTKLEW